MDISATDVSFTDDEMIVRLSDGRSLGVPLVWFPRLLDAAPAQRRQCEISPFGLHWEDLDEDISVEGLLAGKKDNTRRGRQRRAEIEAERAAMTP